ncbi:uncharacterized protein BDV14DRAFT_198189 [Aspergillus stella-maris]|uniref:uncharacterized protein n=1 Tax=Aspergillus stella-maris TaxID=1810926 RepID=UPI003CCE15E1
MFECPSTLNSLVKAHILSFYKAADGEHTAGDWAKHFTQDGIAKKSPDEVKGRESLQAWITSSWATVESREHIVHRVFPFEDGQNEVMLHGSTNMTLRDGSKKQLIWSGRLQFVKDGDGVLINRYTVISDPTPPSAEMLSS